MRVLQRLGFEVIRQRGSHVALRHAGRGVTVFVPVHAGEPLATGTLRAVLRQGGVSVEEFAAAL
jgi:predicted RNA binding protein YcfA (HicA-like mRNA interferase family)